MKLREYQQRAVTGIVEALKSHDSTLAVMPTGTGKTIVFASVIQQRPSGRALLIAHRAELIWQGVDKIERITGRRPGVEMADYQAASGLFGGDDVVVSSVQSQVAGGNGLGRMTRFNPMDFSLLIIDECFAAGTLVDGRNIARLRPGDRVSSVNNDTGQQETQAVVRTFRRVPSSLVRVRVDHVADIVCTPNHPIFCQRGYVPAARLLPGDVLLQAVDQPERVHETANLRDMRNNLHPQELDSQHDALLSSSVCARGNHTAAQDDCPCVLDLRPGTAPGGTQWACACQGSADDLRRSGLSATPELSNDGVYKSPACSGSNDGSQPDAYRSHAGQGVANAAVDGLAAADSWWQRACDHSAGGVGGGFGLADGTGDPDVDAQGQRLSQLLQGRCGQRDAQDCRGDRRTFSQHAHLAGTGQEEDGVSGGPRVAGVEVLQPGSDGTFGGLCPDGHVYNLEVACNNNYFANGVLVHNCHHAPARTYGKVIDYFRQNPNLKILGVTATPDRADEKALGRVFKSVAFEYELSDAINDGWLVPIKQTAVVVEGLDYSKVRTTAGDLNGADLAAVLEFEETLHQFAGPIVKIAKGRRTLVFATTVAQGQRLAEIIDRHQPGSAVFICGQTPPDARQEIIANYSAGRFQFLVNVDVATEGFDSPGIEVVVLAKPTKSRAKFAQMVGRGTRVHPDAGIDRDSSSTPADRRSLIAFSCKPFLEVVDFVGNCGRHRLASVADILGGKYNDDVVAKAKAKAESAAGAPVDVQEALDDAERELREEKEKKARAHLAPVATFQTYELDPFEILKIEPWRERAWHKGKPPTEKQVAFLQKKGIDRAKYETFTQASQLIGQLVERSDQNKCTYKQAAALARNGYPTNLTYDQASKALDALVKNNWQPLPGGVPTFAPPAPRPVPQKVTVY